MKIILSSRAKKQLKRLSKIDQIAVAKKIRSLDGGVVGGKLKGYKNIFRVRVGSIRIVYKKTFREIYIVLIRHRKDVYRLMMNIFK